MSQKRIPFGIMLHGPGGHMNAWKHPSVPADASVNFDYILETTKRAEAAGIAFAFVADGLYINEQSIPHFLNRFEPIALLSALAAVTRKIGLVGTLSTSYSDPFTVARQFASIDLLSNGRAGWNAVTSPLEGSAKNYGRANHPDHALRYEIAGEHIEIVKGLWDSWDDDAFVRDRSTGQFADFSKLHRLNFKGKFHSAEGPLNIQRSPQGQTVLFQAGGSDAGIELAGRHADAVFAGAASIAENRELAQKLKASAVAHGRGADAIKVLPGIGPIVGSTEAEAQRKYEEIRELVNVSEALAYLGRFFDHHDFAQYDVDAPFPELGDLGANNFKSGTDRIKRVAKENGQTLREVALESVTPRSEFVGTAEQIADKIEEWVDTGASDGFVLGFPVQGVGLDDFEREVLPILEQRGRHSREQIGDTLRDHLGLPFRESRYALDDAKAAV
ncbi:FMN-dependent oxidoreductase, nitrilotriacetate monooxygenase family [Devosia sp. YR412]|uniref:LLM class flavin-dependent oxidoreductase n=1 Tax=Devosia sp. YR412 TaxID=1881030 RepID=UPI0008CE18B9|nr:LLM class flavin-dependent oxidoreductase [Devosia sp. YR412]SEP67192.1 FMN-dependent oxidoreductase, nitrilotriacetate monooxygenase family [Devosia sp. YR412]